MSYFSSVLILALSKFFFEYLSFSCYVKSEKTKFLYSLPDKMSIGSEIFHIDFSPLKRYFPLSL